MLDDSKVLARTLLLRALLLAVVVLHMLHTVGCGQAPDDGPKADERTPLVVIGIDGAEWRVIEDLWSQGKLPHLRALADRGVSTHLRTAYAKSPVIWTTIATGRRPEAHGITDFVVETPEGQVPVSSRVRRVPALWNMTARVGLSTAVLGWWASWPAEDIAGIVISDRANAPVEWAVSPEEWEPDFALLKEAALAEPNGFGGNPAAKDRDQIMAYAARELAAEPFSLFLVYYRGVDIASHQAWKYYEPEKFAPIDAAELAANRDRIPEVYVATDKAIGEMLAALDRPANVLVISDHGFHAARREETRVQLDADRILERLGYTVRAATGEVDCARSVLYIEGSDRGAPRRRLRFCRAGREPGGSVTPAEEPAIRARLARDLATVTWDRGGPVFELAEPGRYARRRGAELLLHLQDSGASQRIRFSGEPIDDLVESLWTISGTHGETTHGILIAAGPGIDPEAEVEGISIHDIAPTVLFALGLPIADDFAGRAWTELLIETARRPLRRIASWGTMDTWSAPTSPIDEELVEELRALGYL